MFRGARIIFSLHLLALIMMQTVLQGCQADVNDNEVSDFDGFDTIEGVTVYTGYRACAMVGGLCVHTSDCSNPTTNKGLCTSGRSAAFASPSGIECCFVLRSKPAPCHQYAGICRDTCRKQLLRPSTDCQESGQICCALV